MCDFASGCPTPDEAVALLEIEDVLRGFDERQQQIVDIQLQNHTNEEIAHRLQCSERTVRRLLSNVQQQLEKLVAST
ncbi:MAG: LuxR C-terminal-related transcriptional regulator [Planctomycetaceae bacterium]